jgi:hypothetical protein
MRSSGHRDLAEIARNAAHRRHRRPVRSLRRRLRSAWKSIDGASRSWTGEIGCLEGDRQVLAQLRKAGSDLSKPTEINYY